MIAHAAIMAVAQRRCVLSGSSPRPARQQEPAHAMRIYGSAVVRNEADLIEVFIRHNLTALDGIVVVDHMSQDGTFEILQAMAGEGLPVFLARETSPVFDQITLYNRLVRHIFATSDADWVFPLDADEFLKTPSRGTLEGVLAADDAAPALTVDWQTYVPTVFASDALATLRAAQRLRVERHGLSKVAVSRRFAQTADLTIGNGHHYLLRGDPKNPTRVATAAAAPEVAALAHVPVRSARQFTTKIAVGWLATLNAPERKAGEAFHWREAFDYLRSGRPLSPLQLQAFAANYSVPMDRWLPVDSVELVDDPFLAPISVRYAHRGVDDPLALVLAYAERLIAGSRSA
jgi:hypothetical protein